MIMMLVEFMDKFLGHLSYHLQPYPLINKCKYSKSEDAYDSRGAQTVISDFFGTLVKSRSCFPYFMLVAFEAGSYFRAIILLLVSPLAWLLHHFISKEYALKLMIFVTMAGLKIADIQLVSLGVLSKFFAEEICPKSFNVFSSFGFKCILTELPRIMLEPFAKEYLAATMVVGTELEVMEDGQRATGFVCSAGGVLIGQSKANALKKLMGDHIPHVGLGYCASDYPFMALCEEAYIVPMDRHEPPLQQDKLPKPVVFHDGRLVNLPTPFSMLTNLLWLPIAFPLAVIRIAAGSLLPMSILYYAFAILGVRIVINGSPPKQGKTEKKGVMFVCSHRTLLDPIFLSAALGRPITAVTYSISRLSEFLSPIPTHRLTRNRDVDAANIRSLIEKGDLAICPEGTTCRTPYLLRFSSLFAQLTDDIVPVAVDAQVSMFHGSAARTWKGADPFYFFMNPFPCYHVSFLPKLPSGATCATAGIFPNDVANHIQEVLAEELNFKCTNFTRKDKYRALTASDGHHK